MLKYILTIIIIMCFFISCRKNSSISSEEIIDENKDTTNNIKPEYLTDSLKVKELDLKNLKRSVTLSEVLSTCGKPYDTILDEQGNCRLIYLSKDSKGQIYRTNFFIKGSIIIEKIGFSRPSWDKYHKLREP